MSLDAYVARQIWRSMTSLGLNGVVHFLGGAKQAGRQMRNEGAERVVPAKGRR